MSYTVTITAGTTHTKATRSKLMTMREFLKFAVRHPSSGLRKNGETNFQRFFAGIMLTFADPTLAGVVPFLAHSGLARSRYWNARSGGGDLCAAVASAAVLISGNVALAGTRASEDADILH